MIRSTPFTLPVATENHLSSYASAALAGIGVLFGTQVAEAQIVTTTNAGQTIVDNGTIDLFVGPGFVINSSPELHLALSTSHTSSGFFRDDQVADAKNLNVLASRSDTFLAENFPQGVPINSKAGTFIGSANANIGFSAVSEDFASRGGNFAGKTGYLGFSFTDPNNSAQTDYGWAEITESASQNTLTLDTAAYDESGAPIITGQVPEPGSLALLAGGAGCLAAWRLRRRRQRNTVATSETGSALAS
jgi:hypothetical protein